MSFTEPSRYRRRQKQTPISRSEYSQRRGPLDLAPLVIPPRCTPGQRVSPIYRVQMQTPESPIKTMLVQVALPDRIVFKELDQTATVEDLRNLLQHEHSLETADPKFVLWEVADDVERPLRPYEELRMITRTWPSESSAHYFKTLTETETRDLWLGKYHLEESDDHLSNFDSTISNAMVFYAASRDSAMQKWPRGVLDLSNGSATITERKASNNQVIFVQSFDLGNVDIYSLRIKGPDTYGFALRHQHPRSFYTDPETSTIRVSMGSIENLYILTCIVRVLRIRALRLQVKVPHNRVASSPSKYGSGGAADVPRRRVRTAPQQTPLLQQQYAEGPFQYTHLQSPAARMAKASSPLLDMKDHGIISPNSLLGNRYRTAGNPSRPSSPKF